MTGLGIGDIETVAGQVVTLVILLPGVGVPVTHRLTNVRLELSGTVVKVLMCQDVKTIGKLLNLVPVEGDVGAQIPTEVSGLNGSAIDAELNTLVGQLTDVHQHAGSTHRISSGGLQDLILDVVAVEREFEAQTIV